MAKPTKTFEFHVQFGAIGMKIKAKNGREAKAKLIEKLKKLPANRFLDKSNLFMNEIDEY